MPTYPTLDVLAMGAHPDDVELCAGGTMCLLARQGYTTGVVDFTRGELGTRGTSELREQEAQEAAKIMGLAARENLGLPDGNITNTPETRQQVIRTIRRYRPHIMLVSPPECRHPDHEDASELATNAIFQSGLKKIETFEDDGPPQEPWRPNHVLYYMQTIPFNPTLVVDVTDVWEQRVQALEAFRSQFYNPDYQAGEGEPETFISNPEFFRWVEARARNYGYTIGAVYGEPFLYRHGPFGVNDLVGLLSREKKYR